MARSGTWMRETAIEWWTYGPIAGDYSAIAEPAYFAKPAADLVALLEIAPGMRVADIGTGSGAVAAVAENAVAPGGFVIGMDPSIAMLSTAKRKLVGTYLVAAGLPYLPCLRSRIDVAFAAFALTHVTHLEQALASMIEVVKPGGRIGISSWGASPAATPPGTLWQATAEDFVRKDVLQRAMETALPSEGLFSATSGLHAVLANAGLVDVKAEERWYEVQLSTESFIASRLISLPSRFMQATLSLSAWEAFRHEVSRRIHDSFGSQLKFTVSVNLGVGARAA